VCRGARVAGATVWLDGGDVLVGEESVVEPGAGVKGPTIIGCRTEIRQGAYLRGDCILGDDAVIRGEIKNSVFMDRAAFPHPSYQGDSLCGYASHFGAGANTANVAIFSGVGEEDRRRTIVVRCGGRSYDTGMRKMGVCMGDFSQVGCNSVSDPATFLKPRTVAYPLTRLSKGFYGPDEILKNKPLEHGVIERAPLLARR
jgi:NDP-sugar pyrophosphorylase family protein